MIVKLDNFIFADHLFFRDPSTGCTRYGKRPITSFSHTDNLLTRTEALVIASKTGGFKSLHRGQRCLAWHPKWHGATVIASKTFTLVKINIFAKQLINQPQIAIVPMWVPPLLSTIFSVETSISNRPTSKRAYWFLHQWGMANMFWSPQPNCLIFSQVCSVLGIAIYLHF